MTVLEPVNGTLFGKRVFANVIKDFVVRSDWFRVCLKSNDKRG